MDYIQIFCSVWPWLLFAWNQLNLQQNEQFPILYHGSEIIKTYSWSWFPLAVMLFDIFSVFSWVFKDLKWIIYKNYVDKSIELFWNLLCTMFDSIFWKYSWYSMFLKRESSRFIPNYIVRMEMSHAYVSFYIVNTALTCGYCFMPSFSTFFR